jgi:hypothetical protein
MGDKKKRMKVNRDKHKRANKFKGEQKKKGGK